MTADRGDPLSRPSSARTAGQDGGSPPLRGWRRCAASIAAATFIVSATSAPQSAIDGTRADRPGLAARTADARLDVRSAAADVQAPSRPAPTGRLPFEPLTSADARVGGLHGMACWWTPITKGGYRFAMSGDRAVAKLRGRVATFSPAPGAIDAFPFTHDDWTGPVGGVRVLREGPFAPMGGEGLVGIATLEVRMGRRRLRYGGRIECGS